MTSKLKYTFGNHSDVGKKRKINQDSFGTAKNDWGEIFIVADGMGGHKGGEVASKITVDHMCNEFKLASSDTSPAVFLERSINSANEVVSSKAKEGPDYEGMGTTVVAVIIKDEEAHIGHVGDSRVYIFRNSQPCFITKDHSFVQDLVDQGLISEEEAEDHPKKNRILQAIGTGSVKPDIITKKLYKGDHILMCSDGLSGEVKQSELIRELRSSEPMKACKNLVDLANDRGGPDNITVIAVDVEKGAKPPKLISKPLEDNKGVRLELIIIVLILLCLGFVIYNKYSEEEPTLDIKITRPTFEDSTKIEEEDNEELIEQDKEVTPEETKQPEKDLEPTKDSSSVNDQKLDKSKETGKKETAIKKKARPVKKIKKVKNKVNK